MGRVCMALLVMCACGRVGFETSDAHGADTLGGLCVDLVAHFELDETGGSSTLDSASQVNASLNGTVSFVPMGGVLRGAASFSVDGAVDVTRTQDLPVADFTWSVWIKPSDLVNTAAFHTVASADANALYLKWASAGDLEFLINGVQVFNEVAGFTADSTWQHVAITRAGTAVSLYRNGVLLSTATDGNIIDLVPGCMLRIGAISDCSGGPGIQGWQGLLDDLRVYRRELQASEVESLYRASLAGEVPAC